MKFIDNKHYFLVSNTDGIPFTNFEFVGNSDRYINERIEDEGLNPDLIICWDDMPKEHDDYDFVCPIKEEDGKIVERSKEETEFLNKKARYITLTTINQDIDNDTTRIIEAGFKYDDHIFSLSQNAQNNWNILAYKSLKKKPSDEIISTIDGKSYKLEGHKIIEFVDAYQDYLSFLLNKANEEKAQLAEERQALKIELGL